MNWKELKKHGLLVSNYRAPYKPNGKTNFSDTQKKSGVYLIKENNKVVYVGHSKNNIYRTMYRHFEKWNSPTKVITYAGSRKNYTCKVILSIPKLAPDLEIYFIQKYKPRDNEIKLKLFSEPVPEAENIIEEAPF